MAIVLAVLGILGTLAGVIVGQRMSRSWQREQWHLDQKLAEYRELLDAIARHYLRTTYIRLLRQQDATQAAQHLNELYEVELSTSQAFRSRLLTARELAGKQVHERWLDASRKFRDTADLTAFGSSISSITTDIVVLALAESDKRDALDKWAEQLWQDFRDSC